MCFGKSGSLDVGLRFEDVAVGFPGVIDGVGRATDLGEEAGAGGIVGIVGGGHNHGDR